MLAITLAIGFVPARRPTAPPAAGRRAPRQPAHRSRRRTRPGNRIRGRRDVGPVSPISWCEGATAARRMVAQATDRPYTAPAIVRGFSGIHGYSTSAPAVPLVGALDHRRDADRGRCRLSRSVASCPRSIEADARLVVGQALSSNNPDPNQFATAQQLSAAYVALAANRPVLEATMKRLGMEMPPTTSPTSSRSSPSATCRSSTSSVGASNPDQAAAIANAMAAELVALSPTLWGAQSDLAEFVDLADAWRSRRRSSDARDGDRLARSLAGPDDRPGRPPRDAQRPRVVALQGTYAQYLQFTTGTQANRITIVQPAIAARGTVSPRPLFNVGDRRQPRVPAQPRRPRSSGSGSTTG